MPKFVCITQLSVSLGGKALLKLSFMISAVLLLICLDKKQRFSFLIKTKIFVVKCRKPKLSYMKPYGRKAVGVNNPDKHICEFVNLFKVNQPDYSPIQDATSYD